MRTGQWSRRMPDSEARLQALLDHRVGLWDVIAKAREGSLDSRIRDHATNDLAALVAALPNLAAVAFNGGTAAKIGMQALAESRISLDLGKLPSARPMRLYRMPRSCGRGKRCESGWRCSFAQIKFSRASVAALRVSPRSGLRRAAADVRVRIPCL